MLKGEADPKQKKGWSESLLEFRSGFGEKMKFVSKKRWKSLGPLHLKSKSVARFCFFSKLKSGNHGLGIFHSGVEVHGVEYAFGAHDYATSGVFEVEPRQCPGFKFKKSIFIGTTNLNPTQVREFMEDMACSYYGNMYHLIAKNCNHFCQDVCYKLTGKKIPKWVNRLAQIGSVCSCILPESLKITAVCHDPDGQIPEEENEKKSLRSSFSCLSSISMRQKQLSTSSLLLQSPLRGCLPPWQLKRTKSNSSSMKER
ncbi:DeSI-like protein [Cardamine amara subsp. amara]|uniref:DeSI-like protein n=1 Tax=Cardamine amara subsp. amara TaxID=228776 RepID=A0ABD1A2K8_CARAN